ncbi:hypothetical protein CFC21_088371 [Triticum aestivum]|uniref:Zinc knuckle CX2CX4HX4C domain-containing protein n=2 Tax=Triticum aestivum TaxID=4565 RepID=A0A9R1LBN7_WHEAT|nr:hypothetical protein CFC21_088371 [Triticum aestivum]
MEGNQLAAIQEEEGGERGAGQTEEYQEAKVPDLALNLQVMSISAPRVHNLRATQPWTMGSDNLLIEWIDPADESKTKDDYKFDHIYIGRICLFCGVMFHTVQHCQKRNNIIMERVRSGQTTEDIPFFRYGEWVMDSGKIPSQAIEKEIATNPILSKFQKMFQEDLNKERGKPVLGKTDLHPSFPTRQYYYGSTGPTLTTEKQSNQNLYTREGQVKGTGGAEMHRTTSFNNSGIHDFEMEVLPENVQYGEAWAWNGPTIYEK